MSSGGAAVPAAAVAVVALPIAAIAMAGVATVLAVQWCVAQGAAATEWTGRKVIRLADELKETAQRQGETEVRERLWSLAAGEVLELNRRIQILSTQVRAAGIRTALPSRLTLEGNTIETMLAWILATEPALAHGQAEMHRELAAQESRSLALPLPARPDSSVGDLLAKFERALGPEVLEPASSSIALEDWVGKAAALVSLLDKGALPAERRQVLELAAAVAAQSSASEAAVEYDNLDRAVTRLNLRAAQRHRSWTYLEVLEAELVLTAAKAVDPREPHLDTTRQLRAVAEGVAVATDELWIAADHAVTFAKEVGLAQRKLEAVAACLKARGYQVTATPPGLRATKPEWTGQHSIDIWTPPDGRIRFEMKRDAAKVDDEGARHSDAERDFEESAKEIAGAFPGLRVDTKPNHSIDYREGVVHRATGPRRTAEELKAKQRDLNE